MLLNAQSVESFVDVDDETVEAAGEECVFVLVSHAGREEGGAVDEPDCAAVAVVQFVDVLSSFVLAVSPSFRSVALPVSGLFCDARHKQGSASVTER